MSPVENVGDAFELAAQVALVLALLFWVFSWFKPLPFGWSQVCALAWLILAIGYFGDGRGAFGAVFLFNFWLFQGDARRRCTAWAARMRREAQRQKILQQIEADNLRRRPRP